MAMFVHLTLEKNSSRIKRNGIAKAATTIEGTKGVYAMPVTADYAISLQWVRELKRFKKGSIVAVQFRIPDDEPILLGHYHHRHDVMKSAEAVGMFMKLPDARGYEVIIPRRIEADEIHSIKPVSQTVGWRYFPGSNGTSPDNESMKGLKK